MEEILRAAAAELEAGRSCVLVTLIEALGHSPAKVGAKLLARSDGPAVGTVGGGALERLCRERAMELLSGGASEVRRYSLDEISADDSPADSETVETSKGCGGTVAVFFEVMGGSPEVHIFGAGHIGAALAYYLAPLRFRLCIHDTRKEILGTLTEQPRLTRKLFASLSEIGEIDPSSFVVVATDSHEADYEILRTLLASEKPPRYIGVVGSRRKWKQFLGRLQSDLPGGFDRDRLYSPCGLSIASRDPQEIALSIAAEILSVRDDRREITHLREG